MSQDRDRETVRESRRQRVRSARGIVKKDAGAEMYRFVRDLYPICRSITGDGVRETLRRIGEIVPIEIREVATGTEVFDWTVPKEWNIRDAFIKNAAGERVVDFQQSNLHVVSYSVPVNKCLTLRELRPHLHSLPDHPDWIPYRTSYYDETWGFCVAQSQLAGIEEQADEEDLFEVVIDSTLATGSLSYGELVLAGRSSDEVLISTHVCHPSLCNDNLSGIAVSAFLAKALIGSDHHYTYRFLFIPGTIGAIAWLALNEPARQRVQHGLVLACLGDPGGFHYKRSRQGRAVIDRAVALVLERRIGPATILPFSPLGYDERQYCSPGINLPVGNLARTPHGRFDEYHTSADNLEFVRPEALAESLEVLLDVVLLLEEDLTYLNTNPYCEPRLGRRGLYSRMGGFRQSSEWQEAVMWILNLSDGQHSLIDIAEESGIIYTTLVEAAAKLHEVGLLTKVA